MWTKLAATYVNPSWGHIQQLRLQLKQYPNGDKSVDDYTQGLTTRFDQLALLGKPLEHEEQVEFILAGLPEDYKSVVYQIEGRENPPSITEVHEKLLTRETKLLIAASSASTLVPASANVASRQHQTRNYNGKHTQRQNHSWNNNNNHQQYLSPRPDNRSSRGYQGKCQLYGPHANLATASSIPWVMDSGSTHHLTSDLSNLSLHQPYNGGDNVLIGDGTGLPITDTGSGFLSSTSRPLYLNNVLCVPNIKKNIISVYRLCNANKLFPFKLKSDVRATFQAFKALVENRFSTKISTLYSDNGGEFIALRSFLSSAGISHLTSPPHTAEHNGISERKHRHVVETGLTLLTHAVMPKTY
ncbi:PREDICTED: uncharacterized protein LOC104784086 [Camelina sativa]|uniref:Uncharacterized protein LOC104784086 n=1 Tax=Camelina sativa TaxID=90675 RepID=A0ABM0YXI9_CAMSA|nr:PREDICTED: uncharacterized protein LOC104784086 [Camelina sativa]